MRTCGNCAKWTQETADTVFCHPDMLPGVWQKKTTAASACPFWESRDLHIGMIRLVAYYERNPRVFIQAVAYCTDGHQYDIGESAVTSVRCASWVRTVDFYSDGGKAIERHIWRPDFKKPLPIVTREDKRVS